MKILIRHPGALLIAASALLFIGCATPAPEHVDLYQQSSDPKANIHAHVVILTASWAPPPPIPILKEYAVRGLAEVKESYPQAVKQMLETIYERVDISSNPVDAQGADFSVELDPPFPSYVSLTFIAGSSGKILANLSEPGDPRTRVIVAQHNTAIYISGALHRLRFAILNTLDIVLGPSSMVQFKEARLQGDNAAKASDFDGAWRLYKHAVGLLPADSKLVSDFHKSDTKHLEALEAVKAEQELSATLRRGDTALESGDAVKALAAYALVLKSIPQDTDRARGIQAKQIEAASRMSSRPPVPDDAKDMMAEGKAYAAQARGPRDYVQAAESMKKALAIAPWWGAGYFNTALAEEGAGDWAAAQQYLKIYLKLNPDAEDKEKVREKIANLKVHAERGDSPPGLN